MKAWYIYVYLCCVFAGRRKGIWSFYRNLHAFLVHFQGLYLGASPLGGFAMVAVFCVKGSNVVCQKGGPSLMQMWPCLVAKAFLG